MTVWPKVVSAKVVCGWPLACNHIRNGLEAESASVALTRAELSTARLTLCEGRGQRKESVKRER